MRIDLGAVESSVLVLDLCNYCLAHVSTGCFLSKMNQAACKAAWRDGNQIGELTADSAGWYAHCNSSNTPKSLRIELSR